MTDSTYCTSLYSPHSSSGTRSHPTVIHCSIFTSHRAPNTSLILSFHISFIHVEIRHASLAPTRHYILLRLPDCTTLCSAVFPCPLPPNDHPQYSTDSPSHLLHPFALQTVVLVETVGALLGFSCTLPPTTTTVFTTLFDKFSEYT
jgi:hypothetical protein